MPPVVDIKNHFDNRDEMCSIADVVPVLILVDKVTAVCSLITSCLPLFSSLLCFYLFRSGSTCTLPKETISEKS